MNLLNISPWQLGATLYTPSTHKKLDQIFNGNKVESMSMVVCFEDAIKENEIPFALENLANACNYSKHTTQLRFVRPRSPENLTQILQIKNLSNSIVGFVLPKITAQNVNLYLDQLDGTNYLVMPTMETAEMFEGYHLRMLRDSLMPHFNRVLTMRIGGNDLLNQLSIRRPKVGTIYQTPLQPVICKMVHTFKPYDFHLSAPVFEFIDRNENLELELEQDLMHGLTGKTSIHPNQASIIQNFYKVSFNDLDSAEKILDETSPAVFKMNGAMCEPTTHRRWAHQIVERAKFYGIY